MISMATKRVTRFIRHGHTCLGVAGPASLTLTAGGRNNSLLWSRVSEENCGKMHTWSPYGQGKPTDGLPGFNGERGDPVSGIYHLGNGYRAYNPVLRRFNCPDSLSPFGAGGINPYAYCAGDPVNHTDPTGHISWQGIVGIVAGAVGLGLSLFTAGASISAAGGIAAAVNSATATALVVGGLGIAADVTGIASGATEDVNPHASSVLGWVSIATGIVGMVEGSALAIKSSRGLKNATYNIGGSSGMDGRTELYKLLNPTKGQLNINSLPNEILYNISSHLSRNDLLRLRMVNQKFHIVADKELFLRAKKMAPLTQKDLTVLDQLSDKSYRVAARRFKLSNYIDNVGRSRYTDKLLMDIRSSYIKRGYGGSMGTTFLSQDIARGAVADGWDSFETPLMGQGILLPPDLLPEMVADYSESRLTNDALEMIWRARFYQ